MHCVGTRARLAPIAVGEDLSRCELAVHRRDSDAAQARHLLLELGSAPGLSFVESSSWKKRCAHSSIKPTQSVLICRTLARGLEEQWNLFCLCLHMFKQLRYAQHAGRLLCCNSRQL